MGLMFFHSFPVCGEAAFLTEGGGSSGPSCECLPKVASVALEVLEEELNDVLFFDFVLDVCQLCQLKLKGGFCGVGLVEDLLLGFLSCLMV